MSPPKVSLAGKEPLKNIDLNDEPQEKGDGVEFPSVITVETERRVRMVRNQRKQQRCRRIMCGVVLVIIVTVAALGTMCLVKFLRRHHRHRHDRQAWSCGVKNREMPENVNVDEDNQLITTQHDRDADIPAMEFLHEYNRGLVAYKDTENNKCYIDRLDETFDEGYQRWEAYEVDDRDPKALKIISKPIEIEVLQHIGDVHIYAHCENAKSMWVMEIEMEEVTTEMDVVYV